MTRYELKKDYFMWMCQLVNANRHPRSRSYKLLLRALNETEFVYDDILDGNRAEDGIDLRYRFAYAKNYDQRMVASYLDDRSCSILEMMIALAMRCEEHIMSNPEIGDRLSQWFWDMVESLGLTDMYDRNFNQDWVDFVLERFLTKGYDTDGHGGLFQVPGYKGDIRTLDIWYQMCAYLETISQ